MGKPPKNPQTVSGRPFLARTHGKTAKLWFAADMMPSETAALEWGFLGVSLGSQSLGFFCLLCVVVLEFRVLGFLWGFWSLGFWGFPGGFRGGFL